MTLPSIFLSHGAPDLPFSPIAARDFTRDLGRRYPGLRGIVIVSAHWEAARPTIGTAAQPGTVHDFGGFDRKLYQLRYPAATAPAVISALSDALTAAGIAHDTDPRRGYDHGVWVPLSLMYPQADIPVVQVSLPSRGGPALQTRVGHALASLREQGILLIGSGSITHNLRELDWHAGPESVEPWARDFRDWMIDKLAANDEAALHDYRQQAPNAVRSHPSDEHLLPLYFARGAGGEFRVAHKGFTMGALGMDIYRFG